MAESEEDRRVVQEIAGRGGPPAFIRRAKMVETTWAVLLDTCARARLERLTFVRLRLGQLYELAGSWDALHAFMLHAHQLAQLQLMYQDLQPQLLVPLEATTSRRALRSAANDFVEAIDMFNARWTRWLAKLDLTNVNRAREDYNRYYLLEKECAVGSVRIARLGFAKLEPRTLEEVWAQFPLLDVPRFEF